MKTKQLQHLFLRAGFGITPQLVNDLSKKNKKKVVDFLFSTTTFQPLEIDLSELSIYTQEYQKNKTFSMEFQRKSNEKIREYNKIWIERLANSDTLLREKMTLFWANHFVCKNQNIYFVQQYNNTLRKNALGNFGDFVKEISKEPAMLNYLNSRQNRKKQPNENFARELMELFTLGVGNYSENDVKESARAFTGYSYNFDGAFTIAKYHHDDDLKTFFDETGNFSGDDIINIILKQEQCARFICEKIYGFFVNDQVNEKHVDELTAVFYEDYNIEKLMKFLFLKDWFYDAENIGTKIKSPIELLVGMQKMVPFSFQNTKDVQKIQRLLGQVLLDPPNVAGWKGGRNWIDSNTIILRLKLPSILLSNAEISIKEKGEFEDSFDKYHASNKNQKDFAKVTVDWDFFEDSFKNISFDQMKSLFLITAPNEGTETYLDHLSKSSKKEFCIQLMSLPEYQIC
jgi:uncharacterized protein (DUF1800 family)